MTLRQLILRWVSRGRPPLGLVVTAVARSLISSSAAVGLFVAAIALLVESSHHVPLRTIAVLLILIELVAFLRSPLRFLDRLSAHKLGFAAVQQWRRTVTNWVTSWDDTQASKLGHGEILDRALVDTEQLQNLWLRTLLPGLTALALLGLSGVVLAFLPGASPFKVVLFVLVVMVAATVLALGTKSLSGAEQGARLARGRLRDLTLEASRVASTLALLHATTIIERRLAEASANLREAEQRLVVAARLQRWVQVVASFGVTYLTATEFSHYPLWEVVAVLIGLGTFDLLGQWQLALSNAVAIESAMLRLEALNVRAEPPSGPFPFRANFYVHDYTVNDRTINTSIGLGARVAVTGSSGIGKSTLLKALAGMTQSPTGYITIGGAPIDSIAPEALREFISYVPTESRYLTGYLSDVMELGRGVTRDYEADLQAVGLNWSRNSELASPSRGERSRLAVVRAMATSPAVLILDEPTSGLGKAETVKLLALLDQSDATVIIATHDPVVLAWCSQGIQLS